MTVLELSPRREEVELEELLRRLLGARSLTPFDPRITGFCAQFSKALFDDREAREYPEIQALAFWMRKAGLARMRECFERQAAEVAMAPRGLVFHLPPANVDTVFVYSWLASVLMGNRNLVRISHRASPQTELICRVFNGVMEAAPELAETNVFIRYGHEEAITAAISAVSDVRVIWGGDATVSSIRSIPLPPHGKDLAFPDRSSFCAVNAGAYLGLTDQERGELSRKFYNDTFWYDQRACSSPGAVIWCGERTECEEASREFYEHLGEQLRLKNHRSETATRLNRFTFACRAVMDQDVAAYTVIEDELTLLDLGELRRIPREHPGGGLLYQFHAASVEDIVPFVERRHQTMTYFGFDGQELRRLARLLNGCGLDRIVPIGQALAFHRYWDGYDLFQELTRRVHIL